MGRSVGDPAQQVGAVEALHDTEVADQVGDGPPRAGRHGGVEAAVQGRAQERLGFTADVGQVVHRSQGTVRR